MLPQDGAPIIAATKIIYLVGGPLGHVRQLDLCSVRIAGLQMDRLTFEPRRAAPRTPHPLPMSRSPCLKNWIILSGISTDLSPFGMFIWARASGP